MKNMIFGGIANALVFKKTMIRSTSLAFSEYVDFFSSDSLTKISYSNNTTLKKDLEILDDKMYFNLYILYPSGIPTCTIYGNIQPTEQGSEVTLNSKIYPVYLYTIIPVVVIILGLLSAGKYSNNLTVLGLFVLILYVSVNLYYVFVNVKSINITIDYIIGVNPGDIAV